MIPFNTLSDPLSILRGPNGTLSAPKTALLDPLKTPQEPERAKIGLKLFQILIWAGSTDMIPFCFLSYHFGIPRDLLKGVLGLLKPPKGHIWTFSPTGKFRLGCTYVKWSGHSVATVWTPHTPMFWPKQHPTKNGAPEKGIGGQKAPLGPW